MLPTEKFAILEQVEPEHRVARARLVDQEGGEAEHPGRQGAARGQAGPPQAGLLDQSEHHAAEAQHAQECSGYVDPARRSGRRTRRDGFHDQAQTGDHEWHVDHEDPAPRRDVQDQSGDERTERPGDRSPRRPRPDRRTALLRREGGDDHGQRARCEQRSRDALERPEGDEGPNGWRDRAQQGGQAEPAHAQREHPPLAEDVAQ
jgi:hypothetical protein